MILSRGRKLNQARVWARVKIDATGNYINIPVILLLSNGKLTPLEPLLRYFIFHYLERSHSWMIKLCEIIARLLDYIDANFFGLDKPVKLFVCFINAMRNGTINENDSDPSGLFWFASNSSTIYPKLHMLEELSDWMVREGYVSESLNPWTTATSTEQRFNWIAWYRRNQYSFLGHIAPSVGRSVELEQARTIKLRRQPANYNGSPKAFPADFEMKLLRDGFIRPGKENERDILSKYDWRGICICMLLVYGAKRLSEPFHLWIGDVRENPTRPGEALVRIYHPEEGEAPERPKINGRRAPNRQAYLQVFYPNYPPRNRANGNYHAGFKGCAFSDDRAKFMHVHWLPSHMAKGFLLAYHNYMRQRVILGIDGSRHPFAFVSHKGAYKGEPYSIKAFERCWERAVKRIGLPHMKMYGTTPHGGRHGAGLRANKGGVSQYDAQELFAHRSPESQRRYRVPSPEQVSSSMEDATQKILSDDMLREVASLNIPIDSDWTDIWKVQQD